MPRKKPERPANLPPIAPAVTSPTESNPEVVGDTSPNYILPTTPPDSARIDNGPDLAGVISPVSATEHPHTPSSSSSNAATPESHWLHLNGDYYVEMGPRLREGAVGIVFVITVHKLGHPEKTERRVMKVLQNYNKKAIERERKHFSREVSHPNVLRYLYVGRALGNQREGAVQLHMPLMNYGSLSSVLHGCSREGAKGGPLSCVERLRLLVNVGYQVVAGIHYFHHFYEGMHRDIKPDNILLNSEGRVKLCDFDTCLDDGKSGHTWCGTPIYIAPEVASNAMSGESYAPKCDVWMVGMTLTELFTGWKGPEFHKFLQQDERERYTFSFAEVKEVVDECRMKLEPKIAEWQANEGADEKVRQMKLSYYTEMFDAALAAEHFLRSALEWDPTRRMSTGDMLIHPLFDSVNRKGAKAMEKSPLREIASQLAAVGVKIHKPGDRGSPTSEEQIQSWAALKRDPSRISEPVPTTSGTNNNLKKVQSFSDVNKYLSDLLFHQQSSCHAELREWIKFRSVDLHLL